MFGVIRDNYELFRMSRPTQNKAKGYRKPGEKWIRGLPSTFPYNGAFPTKMEGEFLEWVFKINKDRSPNLSAQEQGRNFNSLIKDGRAFTDHTGALHNIATSRAIIKIVHSDPIKYKGVLSYLFEVIDTKNTDFWSIDPEDFYWLFFTPRISFREPIIKNGRFTGKYLEDGVESFPQFNGHAIIPLHSYGTSVAYIPVNRIKIIQS